MLLIPEAYKLHNQQGELQYIPTLPENKVVNYRNASILHPSVVTKQFESNLYWCLTLEIKSSAAFLRSMVHNSA